MKKEDAIKFLKQLYPNGGHCWLDDQRMEAIGMAIKALQEEPVSNDKVIDKEKLHQILSSLWINDDRDGKVYYNKALQDIQCEMDALEVQEEPASEDKMTISKEWFEHCKKSWYNEGYIDGEYNRDRQFEEPVSDDVNKAAEQDVCEVINTCSGAGIPNDHIPSWVQDAMINEFIHGAKWNANQFEKERLKLCNTLTKEQAKIEQDFVVNFIKENNCTPTFIDAIEYGMKLKLKDKK